MSKMRLVIISPHPQQKKSFRNAIKVKTLCGENQMAWSKKTDIIKNDIGKQTV